MSLLSFLRFLQKGDKNEFDIPVAEQRRLIDSYPIPRNIQERSYFQYMCQMTFVAKWKEIAFDIIATLSYIPVMLFLMSRSLCVKHHQRYGAVSNLKGFEEVIPDVLSVQYEIMQLDMNWGTKGQLSGSDAWYCLKAFFSFFPSSYFSLKTMVKVAQYSELIKKYTPQAIITHSEFSFASSLLTDYCHKRGIKQINVMHGEKLFNIRDTFFHFDECYVWNEYYVRLFEQLKAEMSQFRISVPPSLKIDLEKNFKDEYYADYKYYLAEFNDEQMKAITEAMSFVKAQGKTIRYRLHPRYMDMKIVERYIAPEEIEDPYKVSIVESVASCKCAVGCYSTVLAQAYLSHRDVILDDVAYTETFEKLKEYGYWLIEKGLPKLSELNQ